MWINEFKDLMRVVFCIYKVLLYFKYMYLKCFCKRKMVRGILILLVFIIILGMLTLIFKLRKIILCKYM